MINLIIAVCIGLILGVVSCFFSQGGIIKWKLFVRLTKAKGNWHKYRIVIVVSSIIISLYSYWLYGLTYTYLGFVLVNAYLLAMTCTDIRNRQIPDDATIFFSIVFLVFRIVPMDLSAIVNSLIGIVLALIFPVAMYFIKNDSIGLGDIKLIAAIGIVLGFPEIIFVLCRGFIFAGAYALIMLMLKKVDKKTELPLVPFILLGNLI